jgi:biopolymer transport protein ExbD
MKKQITSDEVNLGFQIAPMIDVVFVIMLYFMVMASSVKKENELKTFLPGVKSAAAQTNEDVPDEITVIIAEDGTVTMNEEEMDSAADKKLPTLTVTLANLKRDADSRGGKVLVTLQTEEQAKYERVIDVLNALAKARIENVTFTVGNEDA